MSEVSRIALHPPAEGADAALLTREERPPGKAGRRRSILFVSTLLAGLLALLVGLHLVFFVAPTEAAMGFVQKIFYFHVPSAWVMFLSVIIGAGASVAQLAGRGEGADRLARSSLEIGAIFGLMVLVTGPLWAHKTWSTAWEWDVRLTTFLVLELVLLSYLLVRRFGGDGARSVAAGIAIFGVAQVPLVYFSVDLWRGQHPPRVVAEGGLHPDMLPALLVCLLGFVLLFVSLLVLRLEIARAEAGLTRLYLLAQKKGLEEE